MVINTRTNSQKEFIIKCTKKWNQNHWKFGCTDIFCYVFGLKKSRNLERGCVLLQGRKQCHSIEPNIETAWFTLWSARCPQSSSHCAACLKSSMIHPNVLGYKWRIVVKSLPHTDSYEWEAIFTSTLYSSVHRTLIRQYAQQKRWMEIVRFMNSLVSLTKTGPSQ